jgi:hypothetical protein
MKEENRHGREIRRPKYLAPRKLTREEGYLQDAPDAVTEYLFLDRHQSCMIRTCFISCSYSCHRVRSFQPQVPGSEELRSSGCSRPSVLHVMS